MPDPALGVILIVLSATAYWLGKFRTLSAVGVFIGIILTGLGGWFGSLAHRLVTTLQGWGGTGTSWFFGVGVPGALSIALFFVLLHDLSPRNSAKKRTFWIATVMAILIAASATNVQALNNLGGQVTQGVHTVQGH